MNLFGNPLQKAFDWYLSKEALPYWCVLALDCMIVMACGFVGYYWAYGGDGVAGHFWQIFDLLLLYLVFYIIGFRVEHTYSGMIRYSSFEDLIRLGVAMTIGAVLSLIASYLVLNHTGWFLPGRKIIFCMYVLGTMLMYAVRVVGKATYDGYRSSSHGDRTPVFIYGTLYGAIGIAKGIRNDASSRFNVRGFISANPETKSDLMMMGLRVYQVGEDLVEIMKGKGIEGLIVSPVQTENFLDHQELIDGLADAGIRIYMMQHAQLYDETSTFNQSELKEVEIEDLLPRDKIEVDMEAIGALLRGKRILITGAAGSIGSEMVRQVAEFKPAELILIDQAETPMHDIRMMMAKSYRDIPNVTVVTSITNRSHMEKIFAEHRPDYVFHAAAYKHVPMMEDNPALAVQNNIYGTRVIADLAVKYGTRKFVMISTDKAVNPTNVMGCSKRICEIYCQSLNQAIQNGECPIAVESGTSELRNFGNSQAQCSEIPNFRDSGVPQTQFVTTRFGNVLGSNGSVIPIFREQIKNGGPVTVTHPDIIRYFMLIPEACRLVLEAGTMGKGGEIFVFDMGKPVRIVDLAKRMISLSGAKNVKIEFTGLRDGEKLYEEVLNDAENTVPTVHPKIKVAKVREYDYATACHNEERLLEESYSYDDMAIVKIMKEIVPEYKSKCSKYEALD